MKKIIISLIIVPVVIISGYLLFPQIPAYFFLKNFTIRNKSLLIHQVPIQKQIEPRSENSDLSNKIDAKWFEFSTPWELTDTNSLNDITGYQFKNNKSILISERNGDSSILNSLYKEKGKTITEFEYFFEENKILSEYDFENYILNVTPNKVSFFSSIKEITETLSVLMVKIMWYGDNVYSFSINGFRGFQFIKQDSPENISVHIFDTENRCFELRFLHIKRDKVDSILSSLKLIEYNSNNAEPSAGD